MDCAKTGKLIAQLRKEKGLTQKNIADALNISNKTVSKWECGLGFPDATFWPDLSVILAADMTKLLEGEMTVNAPDTGNMNRVRFYICPNCQNALFSTGSASIFCCGRKLEVENVVKDGIETPQIQTEIVDVDYYVTIDHPMERDHYILFAAYVKGDRIYFHRLYPQQSPAVRFPHEPGGKLYLYCTKHGLSVHNLKIKK